MQTRLADDSGLYAFVGALTLAVLAGLPLIGGGCATAPASSSTNTPRSDTLSRAASMAAPCQLNPAAAERWALAAPDAAWRMHVPRGTAVQCADSNAELRYPGRLVVFMSTIRGAEYGVVGELQSELHQLAQGYVERMAKAVPADRVRIRELRLGTPSRAARIVEITPHDGPVHVAVMSALPLRHGHVAQVASWALPTAEYTAQRDLVWDLLVDIASNWRTD